MLEVKIEKNVSAPMKFEVKQIWHCAKFIYD